MSLPWNTSAIPAIVMRSKWPLHCVSAGLILQPNSTLMASASVIEMADAARERASSIFRASVDITYYAYPDEKKSWVGAAPVNTSDFSNESMKEEMPIA